MDEPLPTAGTLPYRINQSCGCVRYDRCVMLEERAGYSEVRALSCRWLTPGELAECRFETRFIAYYPSLTRGGPDREEPEPWAARMLRARHLDQGSWCAEG